MKSKDQIVNELFFNCSKESGKIISLQLGPASPGSQSRGFPRVPGSPGQGRGDGCGAGCKELLLPTLFEHSKNGSLTISSFDSFDI